MSTKHLDLQQDYEKSNKLEQLNKKMSTDS